MTHSLVDDPWLELPLAGLHLIEASAGTGKTFTVATLFTRLVVEKVLRMGQILTVTFTDAATQELRKRIRERLAHAAQWVGTIPQAEHSAEKALTCAILQRHQHNSGESDQALRLRLRRAAEETDLAAIFTIHGFCARVLREYALESRHTLATTELLTDTQALYAELATDIWRRYSSQKAHLDTLTGLWKNPESLAQHILQLAGELPLYPLLPEVLLAEPRSELEAAATVLLSAIADHLHDAQAKINAALARKELNKQQSARFEKGFIELQTGCALGYWPLDENSGMDRLATHRLAKYCNKGKQPPSSPLFDAIQVWVDAYALKQAWLRQKKIILLHQVRQDIRQQLAEYKQQQRTQIYDDLINNLANALQGEGGQRFARSLRNQYKVALVDEFQDTDTRQWHMFRQLFADPDNSNETALFLIGDPKQAIYGFRGGDIHTYLQARSQAAKAPALKQNFRSRPAVLRALQRLYETAGSNAFGSANIRFEPVLPGDKLSDTHYLRQGQAAPALHIALIPGDTPSNVEPARAAVTSACVQHIYHLLSDARKGKALIQDEEKRRPVSSGDIAVLVRSYKDAVLVQQALTQLGIAAVAAGRQSLFATEQAQEIHWLLLALLHPADEGRLRAALSSVLLGYDAAALAALDSDRQQQHDVQQRLLQWRARWQRSGIFALLSDICAQHAPRLLSLIDGERRLSNTLQLAQVLQQASRHSLGLNSLLDWLHQRMIHANDRDDEQQLHLESDARCVQVITLHRSKGLEYPFVYLPFAGIYADSGKDQGFVTTHDGTQRALHWKIDAADPAWQRANQQAKEESYNEEARLLYVGLTRAQQALWLAAGALKGLVKNEKTTQTLSPLAALLGDCHAKAKALADCVDIHIYTVPTDEPALPRLPPEQDITPQPPRQAHRHLAQDWWVYSFTQLAHADGNIDRTAIATQASGRASDEISTVLPEELDGALAQSVSIAIEKTQEQKIAQAQLKLFSGSRFGNVLHSTLENTDFAAWANWQPGQQAPEGQREPISRALQLYGYQADELEAGISVTTELIGQTLTVSLPEGGALHSVPPDQRRAEIEFHFAMQPVAVADLLRLLHAHGVVRQRQGFGLRRQLEGLMTGKIDLTYIRDGRWYVLDYKSNQLADYRAESLAAAMQHSEYDLQGLIYTVALHRWLRFRLGEDYDYSRDFGGIRYLFCRGLDVRCHPSPGVYAHCFSAELVNALDDLFGNHQP